MSGISRSAFTADATFNLGPMSGDSLMLNLSDSLGSGTLNVNKYHDELDSYITVASFTSIPSSAQEIVLGRGSRFQLELTGSTSPTLKVDRWVV